MRGARQAFAETLSKTHTLGAAAVTAAAAAAAAATEQQRFELLYLAFTLSANTHIAPLGCSHPTPLPSSPTHTHTGWALAVSMSRAFGFKRLGGHALAPLIDMANHAPVSNAEVRFSTDTGHVNLVANKQVCGEV